MTEFPMSSIGGIAISRLIIGSNPFFGFSHYSAAKDAWLKRYFTDERIVEVMATASAEGLNAFVSGNTDRARRILDLHEEQTGRHIHWIATPGGDDLEELKANIRQCAKQGVEICMPHQNWTDNHCLVAEHKLPGYEEVSKLIRDLGMIPALSCHHIETVKAVYDGGYDVEAFIVPFNVIGFLCTVETDWMARVINEVQTPIICIKPLAAQRVLPPTGLQFVYDNIKPVDMVCIGMASPEEVSEDVALAREFITGTRARRQYQTTYSKRNLLPRDTQVSRE